MADALLQRHMQLMGGDAQTVIANQRELLNWEQLHRAVAHRFDLAQQTVVIDVRASITPPGNRLLEGHDACLAMSFAAESSTTRAELVMRKPRNEALSQRNRGNTEGTEKIRL